MSFSDDDCSQEYNFNLPLPSYFDTPRLQLTPFVLDVHGEAFYSIYKSASPEIGQYLPISFPDYQSIVSFIQGYIKSDPGCIILAIIDKTKDSTKPISDRLAGIIGIIHTSPQNMSAEIGPVIVFPEYQRTFVSSNAVGLVLKYLLDVPSPSSPRGLGFRRVAWTANPDNVASIRAAERFGFKKEGVIRWSWCLPPEATIGKQCPERRGRALGRDSVLFSVCWDDWENGAKEQVEALMQRIA